MSETILAALNPENSIGETPAPTAGDSIAAAITPDATPRLYAGKYKNIEDLENAYKNAARVYEENKDLKGKLDSAIKVPEDYALPEDIALREQEAKEIKLIAKQAGLTQDQFVRTAKEMHTRIQSQIIAYDDAKKTLGEESLNVMTDYVSKHYPPSLHEHVLTKLVMDKKAREEAMEHRNQILNNQAPGIRSSAPSTSSERYDGEQELAEAAKAAEREPGNTRLRDKFIKLAADVGHARSEK